MRRLLLPLIFLYTISSHAQHKALLDLKLGATKKQVYAAIGEDKKRDQTITPSEIENGNLILVLSVQMGHKFTMKNGKLYRKVSITPDPNGELLAGINQYLQNDPDMRREAVVCEVQGQHYFYRDGVLNGVPMTHLWCWQYSDTYNTNCFHIELWYTDGR